MIEVRGEVGFTEESNAAGMLNKIRVAHVH